MTERTCSFCGVHPEKNNFVVDYGEYMMCRSCRFKALRILFSSSDVLIFDHLDWIESDIFFRKHLVEMQRIERYRAVKQDKKMLKRAEALALKYRKLDISFLERKLEIGYNHARMIQRKIRKKWDRQRR